MHLLFDKRWYPRTGYNKRAGAWTPLTKTKRKRRRTTKTVAQKHMIPEGCGGCGGVQGGVPRRAGMRSVERRGRRLSRRLGTHTPRHAAPHHAALARAPYPHCKQTYSHLRAFSDNFQIPSLHAFSVKFILLLS